MCEGSGCHTLMVCICQAEFPYECVDAWTITAILDPCEPYIGVLGDDCECNELNRMEFNGWCKVCSAITP